MKDHARRAARAWSEKMIWDGIYNEAHRWVTPYRRPSTKTGQADKRTEHIFDNQGIVSTFRGAGELQQALFPPGQPFFKLKPGPVTKLVTKALAGARRGMGDNGGPEMERDEDWFARQLDSVTEQITPFLATGEWDNAASELCLDLYVGTGAMLLLSGDKRRPVRFVTLPIEEVAFEAGPYGDHAAMFWKTRMSRRAIKTAFPGGTYDSEFLDALQKSPEDQIDLCQDFVQDGERWKMIVWLHGAEDKRPVIVENFRTQPFLGPRFYRVPGEPYGRGPALLALPTVKTLNKAMELTLKAAAIQMLGIWGYRPGGTFNPDTARLAPGAMWAMQATGGIVGADVTRLDTAAGRIDVSGIVLQELRTQLQAALHDNSLPEGGLTPKSAAEVLARLSKVKSNYVGAFGRMVHEIIPVVVPRLIEILAKQNLLATEIKIDQLLVAIDVISPLAQALKADHHRTTVDAITMVAQLEGPEGVARRFKLDELLPNMIRDLGVDSQYVRSLSELKIFDDTAMQQAQAAQLAQAALAKPKEFAEVLDPQDADEAAAV